jgi:beta-mannosidase
MYFNALGQVTANEKSLGVKNSMKMQLGPELRRACGAHSALRRDVSKMIAFYRLAVSAITLLIVSAAWQATEAAAAPTALSTCAAGCSIDLGGTWRFLKGELIGANQADPANRVAEAHWQDIRVPSNWYLEGFDVAGVNWYRRQIDVPSLPGKAITLLRFEGVDYFADVWLNGVYLGSHEGYFEPFSFDVSTVLRPGKRNELVARVNSPIEHPSDWSLRKRLIKGIFSHHDTRPGGAWSTRGQERNTGGIWSDVSLQVGVSVALDEPRVRARLATSGRPTEAFVTLGTWTAASTTPRQVEAEIEFEPHNFSGPAFRARRWLNVGSGSSEHALAIALPDAHLWWPADLGAPDLYRVRVTLRQGEKVLDRRETVSGLREIFFDPQTQTWHVNGKRLFLRGTNYIATQWLSEMGEREYARDVALMRKANVNAVRVHSHVGDRRFYRACDEVGLLVWQDFPLQWGYVDSTEFIDEAQRQAVAMVRTLDNHPSIFAWSMHNEPPWDAWWMKYKYPDYDPNQNRALDERLEHTVRQHDDSRHVHKASTSSEHQWLGWYSGHWTDFNKPTTHSLITEFGAQALPDIESLRRILNDDQIFPDTDSKLELWAFYNFQKEETFKNAKIELGKDIHAFIANSQAYQAQLTQLAAESLRRQKYQPVGAIFQFMFVEDWPSMNWGVLDYWRRTKPGYKALARAYQPLLPSIEWSVEQPAAGSTPQFGLWLVNDLPRAYADVAFSWELVCNARVLAGDTFNASVEADQAIGLRSITAPALPSGRCALGVTVRGEDAALLAENLYEFIVP